jgi:hypothetical protein
LKKLAIVGAHRDTRDDAPYDDLDYDIWSISNYANAEWMKRSTAVIEIHQPVLYTQHPDDREYWGYLKNTDAVVYMLSMHNEVKNAKFYPLPEIRKELLSNIFLHGEPVDNLGSSIDYALALGIYLKYNVIDVYGVEMGIDSQYMTQRPGFGFWTGLAAGRGITVNINCTTDIFPKFLYGRNMVGKDKHLAFLRIGEKIDG